MAGRDEPQDNTSLLAVGMSALWFGIRLAAAVSLALFTAFYLQLETPSWAGTSAAIVCQPIVGSSLFKGVFRMIGTVVGAVAAVILTAMFPQNRAEFLVGMLLWVSLCSFVSLRRLRSDASRIYPRHHCQHLDCRPRTGV
jgi:uncharacterized membrane protein YccC